MQKFLEEVTTAHFGAAHALIAKQIPAQKDKSSQGR
jgi:hypothetical protein